MNENGNGIWGALLSMRWPVFAAVLAGLLVYMLLSALMGGWLAYNTSVHEQLQHAQHPHPAATP